MEGFLEGFAFELCFGEKKLVGMGEQREEGHLRQGQQHKEELKSHVLQA